MSIPYVVLTPKIFLLSVWPLPRSLATTYGISVDFFSSPYLDVSVQAVPYVYLCIQYTLVDLHLLGCPIRKSPDITPAYGSPRLIAVNHVLHRLPVPRHSPCALCSLTFFNIMRSSKRLLFELFHSLKMYFITLFFLKNTMTFQDGRHSILSLVLSFITLFSFQGAI